MFQTLKGQIQIETTRAKIKKEGEFQTLKGQIQIPNKLFESP